MLLCIGSIRGSLCVICQDLSKVSLAVRVGGIKIFALPTDPTRIRISDYSRAAMERKAKRAQKKKRKKDNKKTKKEKKTAEPSKKAKVLTGDTLSLIIAMVQSVLSRLGHNVKIVIHRWHLVVATDDAAKTALLYAAAQNGTNFLFAFLDETSHVTFPTQNTPYVTADFGAQKCGIDAEIRIYMRVGQALRLLICTAIDFLKYKQKQKKEG